MKRIQPIFLALTLVTLVACGDERPESDSTTSDSAWADLMSDGEMTAALPGESRFEHLMRDVEITNQRRRELGRAFWREYPDDPRRYRWLMRAVHLEPYYPQDVKDWAMREARPGPNTAAVDVDARAEWEAAYPAMREAFWRDPNTTERERRYLRDGELLNRLKNALEADARGESVDGQGVLDDILAYAHRFPHSFEPSDDVGYTSRISGLWKSVHIHADALELDRDELDAFTEALAGVSDVTGEAIDRVLSNGNEELQRLLDGTADLSEAEWPWVYLRNEIKWDSTGRVSEGIYIITYQRMIGILRNLEVGKLLWEEVGNSELRTDWYLRMLRRSPGDLFTQRVAGRAGLAAKAWGPGDKDTRDTAAAKLENGANINLKSLDEWRIWREAVPQGLVDPILEVRYDLLLTQIECKVKGNNAGMKRALNELRDLYRSEVEHADNLLYSTVRDLRDSPRRYCFSEEKAEAFLSAVPALGNERLTALIRGPLAVRALRSTPFDFSSPTWAGGEFEFAELQGKIVLFQFWDTNCAACFAAIPTIQEIHATYRDRGFEVVSVNVDDEDRGPYVERIRKGYDFDWPLLKAYEQWPDLNERFGWGHQLPQYMLFDRDGLLAAYTPEFADLGIRGALQNSLDEILAAE